MTSIVAPQDYPDAPEVKEDAAKTVVAVKGLVARRLAQASEDFTEGWVLPMIPG